MAPNITEGWIPDVADGLVPDYSIPCDPSNYQKNAGRSVSYVVMHYTGNAKDTAQANANYFHGAGRKASAHFFVDENSIYQSVRVTQPDCTAGASRFSTGGYTQN
ncbi:MAG: N-acetylmuramoyl-L-alanine amidase, partial [Lachnospiraceae bacterium]|nr:N-acetylmuramoyl-L-alanine amidase [Lachnospiraceae bacterium]